MRIRTSVLNQGLSLLEVMLVVLLIAVIATLVIPRISDTSDTAKCKACRHNRAELNAAIERYGVSNSSYPTDLTDLVAPDYFPQGIPTCPVSGAAYSMNATTHRIDGHTSAVVPGDH
jgi:prepilin-type N-terminal cleavage/methylation domain-containing protein